MALINTHTCDNCGHLFEIVRLDGVYEVHRRMIIPGTGKNMVYNGAMDRDYALCPACGTVEHQWSAEARDQTTAKADPPL